MAAYFFAGRSDSLELAKCDICASALRALPYVRCRRYVRIGDEWETFVAELCSSWQIQGWGPNNDVMVWTGTGQLIGNSDDFLTLAYEKYGIDVAPSTDDLEVVMEQTKALASAEAAAKGKFAAPSMATEGVTVLMVKPNAGMPQEYMVRETAWKSDMDRLLGKVAVLSESVELLKTSITYEKGHNKSEQVGVRIFAWVNSNSEFKDRKNRLASLALASCPMLAQMSFRYCLYGTVVFFAVKAENDTPVRLTANNFDEIFCGPEMETEVENVQEEIEQELATVRIQAAYKGRSSRKTTKGKFQEKREADAKKAAEEEEMETAVLKIQSRFKGNNARKDVKEKRKEIEEQEKAATNIQSRFRGNKMRSEKK